jgi:RNA polymerase sigma-70 factor (ECF subfamily)
MAVWDDFSADAPAEGWLEGAQSSAETAHQLYEQFRGIIYSYLLSLRIDSERAKDLTQECFFKYYLFLRAGKEVREPRPWLFKTASWLALNYFREIRSQKTVSTEDVPDDQLDSRCQVSSVEDEFIMNNRMGQLAEAFLTLSPQQQICLHLRAEGLRYREIAEVLEVSIPTVSEFIRRGIARLRRTLNA